MIRLNHFNQLDYLAKKYLGIFNTVYSTAVHISSASENQKPLYVLISQQRLITSASHFRDALSHMLYIKFNNFLIFPFKKASAGQRSSCLENLTCGRRFMTYNPNLFLFRAENMSSFKQDPSCLALSILPPSKT